VHSEAGPIVNDRWEKAALTTEDLEKIKPLLEKIKVLKEKGLTSFGTIASYIYVGFSPLRQGRLMASSTLVLKTPPDWCP
jgi:hypothetical protein